MRQFQLHFSTFELNSVDFAKRLVSKLTLDIFWCGSTAKSTCLYMCFERPNSKRKRLSQRNIDLQQTNSSNAVHHKTVLSMMLSSTLWTTLVCFNQCKQRHVPSVVHWPIKTPPRAFFCAFCCTLKNRLKSNMFHNSVP